MIRVTPEARLFVAHAPQVTFGVSCALLLQGALELEQPPFNRLPRALAQKTVVGRDRGARQAEIDANNLIGWGDVGCRNAHDDMQPPAPVAEDQIGGIGRIARVFGAIVRNTKADCLSATN